MRGEFRATCAALSSLAGIIVPQAGFADQVFLTNGDRISGSIVSADGGKVVITPDFAPKTKITIAQKDISSFTSPKPILLKLTNGTLINQPVVQSAAGTVTTAPPSGAAVAPQPVQVASIAQINPSTAWTGSVGVNGLYTHAATSSASIGLSGDTTRRTDNDRITGNASYFYGQQTTNGVTTENANNWTVEGQYDYFLTKQWYVYATTKAQGDHVNYLTLRLLPGVGVGYQWFDRDDFHLNTEAGPSYVYEQFNNGSPDTHAAAVRISNHIDKSWDADRYKFFNDITLLPTVTSIRNYLVQTDTGLRVQLFAGMYSEVKGEVDYNNHPATGAKNLTTQVTLGVGITY